MMTRWFVESPSYEVTEYVCEYGGPTYDVCDYAEIEAPTRRAAVTAAVKQWLSERGDTWPTQQRGDGLSPFAGVRAVSEDEARAAAFTDGPPERAPEFCDLCPSQDHAATRWVWCDEFVIEGEATWGWFGTCGLVGLGTPNGSTTRD